MGNNLTVYFLEIVVDFSIIVLFNKNGYCFICSAAYFYTVASYILSLSRNMFMCMLYQHAWVNVLYP